MIDLKNIHKVYKTKTKTIEALKGVSLSIKKGDIFGIIGYSGSGKSTLVRCINQLEKVSEGSVEIDGVEINKLNEKELRAQRQKIGMIFQHFNLLTYDTVFENVALPLVYQKLDKKKIKQRVDELLKLVGLYEKRDAYPSQLSGGQKQRVAIARALANEPQILLSDEATSALDPQTTDSILQLLKELNKKLGLTIVLITHQMHVIQEVCNRVGVLDSGVIIEEGNVLDVFSNPKHKTTKEFVSSLFQTDKIDELLENKEISKIIDNEGIITRLLFTGAKANDALISDISRRFVVDASIIFGKIEIIQDKPVGSLFIAFTGNHNNISAAIDYVRKSGVQVELIKGEKFIQEGVV